jgi:hypothetical protein
LMCLRIFFELMICLRTLLRIYKKKSNPKKFKTKKFFGCPKLPSGPKKSVFGAY